jgi:hypothetical protein
MRVLGPPLAGLFSTSFFWHCARSGVCPPTVEVNHIDGSNTTLSAKAYIPIYVYLFHAGSDI